MLRRKNQRRLNSQKSLAEFKNNRVFCQTLITADALLTQRQFVSYLIENKQAHYHFTVRANQPRLLEDLQYYFKCRQTPDALITHYGHGRTETRKIWVTNNSMTI